MTAIARSLLTGAAKRTGGNDIATAGATPFQQRSRRSLGGVCREPEIRLDPGAPFTPSDPTGVGRLSANSERRDEQQSHPRAIARAPKRGVMTSESWR